MSALRVYADFNDLPGPTNTDQRMWLSYWGSLCDLARQHIRLRDGMHITVYDSSDGDEDMEVDGIVRRNVPSADLDGLLTSADASARCPRCGGGVLDFLRSSEGNSA